MNNNETNYSEKNKQFDIDTNKIVPNTGKNDFIFSQSSSLIFNKWKDIQKKLQILKMNDLNNKKKVAATFKRDYDEIMSNVENNAGVVKFSLSNLIRAIKYLNSSNAFFNNRLQSETIDQMLLLIYIYEWICLDKQKDVNTLGTKEQVIKKLKVQAYNTKSEYWKIFENLDLDFEESKIVLIERIASATFKTYESIIALIKNDSNYFLKLDSDIMMNKVNDNESYYVELWKDTFTIAYDKFLFSYSTQNSDDKIICVNAEVKDDLVAVMKFKIFETFTSRDGAITQEGFGKELLSLKLVNKKYNVDTFEFLSNSYVIANRVIKNIFIPEMKIKAEEKRKGSEKEIVHIQYQSNEPNSL